jgi:Xaa-Pro aminopeptidase
VPDVLIYGDTIRSPELRHEVPLAIPDPFLYAEHEGRRCVVIASLELPRVRELSGLEAIPNEDIGVDELIAAGVDREEIYLDLTLRACTELGIAAATVPIGFPLALADHLRANGIELTSNRSFFTDRRRVKSEVELAGIRRAQRACEAGMDAVRDLLRRAKSNGSGLAVDGEPLTSELLRRRIGLVFIEHDMVADELIASHGPQTAVGHDMGSGQVVPGEPIVVDLWPRDRQTACFADMTRTFVVGEPPEELQEWHRLCLQALEEAVAGIKPRIEGRDLFIGTCELFEQNGYRTQRTKTHGEILAEGFTHSLGHGVGLEVHEAPGMGIASYGELVAGDVVTVEPGLYRPGFGGCRLEDIVLVTGSGAENLTDYPYDLSP